MRQLTLTSFRGEGFLLDGSKFDLGLSAGYGSVLKYLGRREQAVSAAEFLLNDNQLNWRRQGN
jgi:hypothetical protein